LFKSKHPMVDRSFVEHILTPSETWERIEWINAELRTCLQFTQIERKERKRFKSRLRLLGNQKVPCFSYIGQEVVGDQDIGWVEKCSSTGHIGGFLMTALGFMHEHMRPDRDQEWIIIVVIRPCPKRGIIFLHEIF